MEVRKLTPHEYPQWNALVRSSSSGTIYHETTWLAPICEAAGDTLAIYGFFLDGRLVGGVPTQLRKKGPLTLAQRAYATPYAGVIADDDLAPPERRSLEKLTRGFGRRFSKTILTFSPFLDAAAAWRGWCCRERHTYLLSIDQLDLVWRRMSQQARNKIRKARKEGITVSHPSDATAFYHLFNDVFSRVGSPLPFDGARFRRCISQLESTGAARQYLATTEEGQPCAACLVVYDQKRAYHSLAASHETLRRTGAPSLLLWEAFRDARRVVNEFDLGGANIPQIAQHKRQFGATLVSYQELTRYRTPLERLAFAAFDRFRARSRREEGG